jgi:uncharacterized protein (DUF2141 family)
MRTLKNSGQDFVLYPDSKCHRAWKSIVALLLCSLLTVSCSARPDSPSSFPDGRGTLVIEATGFRSEQGQALASLFATAEGFPGATGEEVRTVSASIGQGKARLTFTEVQWGEYAVSVLHDENGDGVMQNNWLGRAREGHGISMDPESRFGPPDFVQARFVFMAEERVLPIRIRYPEKRGPGTRKTQN